MPCAGTVGSLATTRRTVDKSGGQEAKAKREVTNMLMDGLGKVTNKLVDGGKRQIGRVQDSG